MLEARGIFGATPVWRLRDDPIEKREHIHPKEENVAGRNSVLAVS
jgi:hypothetical protein